MARPDIRIIYSALALVAGVASSSHAQARIDGTIRDSLHNMPLAGATVVAIPGVKLRDTVFHSVLSDAKGHFSFAGLIAGHYKLSVEHPTIDSTGIGVPELEVDVLDGSAINASLGTPSIVTLRRAFCPKAPNDGTVGAMLGTIRTADGTPLGGAKVVFFWRDFEVDRSTFKLKSERLTSSAVSDANGVYRACDLPLQRPLFVQAQTSEQQSGVVQEQIDDSGVLLRDFRVANAVVAAAASVATSSPVDSPSVVVKRDAVENSGAFSVTGRVHRVDGASIKGAQVSLLGTGRTVVADDDGGFRFSNVPAGTHGVEVMALGFFPRYLRVEIGADLKPLQVRMERVAVVLDSLRVVASRTRTLRGVIHREFDERAKSGAGFFLTENDIANKDPILTVDVLKQVPGVSVMHNGSKTYIASTHGRTNFQESECVLDVFLDGRKILPDEINMVAPGDLHGVEVHSTATTPPKYRVGQCGAIFLWTK